MSKPLIYFDKSINIINNKIAGKDVEGAYIYLYDINEWSLIGADATLTIVEKPTSIVEELQNIIITDDNGIDKMFFPRRFEKVDSQAETIKRSRKPNPIQLDSETKDFKVGDAVILTTPFYKWEGVIKSFSGYDKASVEFESKFFPGTKFNNIVSIKNLLHDTSKKEVAVDNSKKEVAVSPEFKAGDAVIINAGGVKWTGVIKHVEGAYATINADSKASPGKTFTTHSRISKLEHNDDIKI